MIKINKQAYKRFFLYTSIGTATFLLDLFFLYISKTFLGVSPVIATPFCFFIALSINFLFSRAFVFRGTAKKIRKGYFVFLAGGLFSMSLTTFLMYISVSYANYNFLVSRIFIAAIIGFMNYLFNLYHTFDVAGKKL